MSEIQANKLTPSSGSGVQLGNSGHTITIPSGATINNSGTATGFGGDNTPSFKATCSGTTTVANDANVKIAFNTEVWDTDSAFDTSNYRFTVPANNAGKYIFSAKAGYTNPNNGTGTRYQFSFYKNGSIEDFIGDWSQAQNASADPTFGHTACINLSVGDYVDFRVYQNSGSSEEIQDAWARFFGYKLTGV